MTLRLALAALIAAAFGLSVASAEGPPGIEAMLSEARWIAPGADIVGALSQSPGECLRETKGDERRLVEIGRAGFRSPLLLGGQAARNGLSCNSCHRDGHGNAAFFLHGLSGNPGTADVTSSLFSKSREDGVFNPVAIPTLVNSGVKESFGTVAPKPSLHAFIGAAIGEEFQGEPPPEIIIKGLAAYVARLDAKACGSKPQAETVRSAMRDVERALAIAAEELTRGDVASADFLLLAAQRALRPVHERFSGDALAPERLALENLGREIAGLRNLAASAPKDALDQSRLVEAETRRLARRLNKSRKKSLYDLQVLQRAVEEAPAIGD